MSAPLDITEATRPMGLHGKTLPAEGVMRSHRIRLIPTAAQERAFYGFAKVTRWTWNLILRAHNTQISEWKVSGEQGNAPTISGLKARFNRGRSAFAPWTTALGHRDCWSQPFVDLQRAFAAKRSGIARHPRFKRFDATPSFYVANDKFRLDEKRVRLPKVGWVRMTEALRFDGKVMGARVTRDGAGRWFLSVQVANVAVKSTQGTEALGIDVGITHTVMLSTGEVFHAPRMTKNEKAKMRRLQRSKSRKYEARKARRAAVKAVGGDVKTVKVSNREQKAQRAVGKLHAHITDRRNDWQHKTTTAIVRRATAIGLETLSIRGMMKSRRRGQARALSDIGLGEVHRQLRYKAWDSRTTVQDFPWSYASSQWCSSGCGHRHKMPLSERVYRCPKSGLVKDRDVNAALNLVPSAWRVMRGTDESRNVGEQAMASSLVMQPVPTESVKSCEGSHGFT